jgi:hypothetical protein
MSTNPLKFILKLIKPHTKNAGNAMYRKTNSCGLCVICGEITR